jgi:oxygen-dependent protoporphyrinogen oxidase
MKRVCVIGGGITGLVAAERLRSKGAQVTLIEASSTLGGKISTVDVAGETIEAGPDSFLVRDATVLELCERLGLAGDLVEPHDFGAWIWRTGELHRMPSGFFFGLPPSLGAAWGSSILSRTGALRTLGDALLPGPLRGPDISVGELVRRRFGEEVLETLVDPILAGTRAGDVDKMSLAAALPQLDAIARSHRRIGKGLRSARKDGSIESGAPRFYAPRGGMRSIVDALTERLADSQLITDSPVTHVAHDGRWQVRSERAIVTADALLMAIPASATALLLGEVAPDAAELLRDLSAASVAIAVLAFSEEVELPEGGSGVLVPSQETATISGCTWFSRKWPHLDTKHPIVRAFVGRGGNDPSLELSDDALLGRVSKDLSTMLGLPAPVDARIVRWAEGLPQYEVGHRERLASIREELDGLDIEIAGAPYDGSGLPDCVAQAERAATRLGS